MWFMLACTTSNDPVVSAPKTTGAIEMNMIVSSAINGEYEPCG